MSWLRDAPLQRKITIVALGTALTTLIFSVSTLSYLEIFDKIKREQTLEKIELS